MFCVKTANEADFWLSHWGEVDVYDVFNLELDEWRNLIEQWANVLGRQIVVLCDAELSENSLKIFYLSFHVFKPNFYLPQNVVR